MLLRELVDELEVPPLGRYGVTASAIADLVTNAQRWSSMQGNSIALTREELTETLAAAL
jgi:hypothetical protein